MTSISQFNVKCNVFLRANTSVSIAQKMQMYSLGFRTHSCGTQELKGKICLIACFPAISVVLSLTLAPLLLGIESQTAPNAQ